MISLPNIDTIQTSDLELVEFESIFVDVVTYRIYNVIEFMPIYSHSSEEEKERFRERVKNIIIYVFKHVSSRRENEFIFRTRIESNLGLVDIVLISHSVWTAKKLITEYVTTNLSSYGIFTEYWNVLSPIAIFTYKADDDAVLYMRSLSNDENYQLSVERSFEENRQSRLNEVLGEHHNWKLSFRKDDETGDVKEIPRVDENKDCLLCYERSDYVCAKCNYPMCSQCLNHLKHSTDKCPMCQSQPMELVRIEGGDRNIESNNEGDDFVASESSENENTEAVNSDNNVREDVDDNSENVDENVDESRDHEQSDEQDDAYDASDYIRREIYRLMRPLRFITDYASEINIPQPNNYSPSSSSTNMQVSPPNNYSPSSSSTNMQVSPPNNYSSDEHSDNIN